MYKIICINCKKSQYILAYQIFASFSATHSIISLLHMSVCPHHCALFMKQLLVWVVIVNLIKICMFSFDFLYKQNVCEILNAIRKCIKKETKHHDIKSSNGTLEILVVVRSRPFDVIHQRIFIVSKPWIR